MSKAYIVYQSWNTCDDYSTIAVFLDEKKCDDFIADKNKDWYEDDKKESECKRCRGYDEDCYSYPDEDIFNLKDVCDRADIGTDRYGIYCGNDMSNGNRSSDYYWKREVVLIE